MRQARKARLSSGAALGSAIYGHLEIPFGLEPLTHGVAHMSAQIINNLVTQSEYDPLASTTLTNASASSSFSFTSWPPDGITIFKAAWTCSSIKE